MFTLFFLIALFLSALAALPYIHAPIKLDERDGEEPSNVRLKPLKPTRQR